MILDNRTEQQAEAMREPPPWCWCVVMQDGSKVLVRERANAEGYAAKNHGVLVPLSPPGDWVELAGPG